MFELSRKIKINIGVLALILLGGCFDTPDDFVSPTWDIDVNIPITQKEYSLLEIVDQDSSFLNSSSDPANLGLIYFGDTQFVSNIRIENELSVDPFQTYFSHKIDLVNISVPLPVASNIQVEDWTNDVTSGSTQVFPEQEGNVTIDIEGVKSVESLTLDHGHLTLVLYNNLPVDITLQGIIIRNKISQSIIAQKINSPGEWLRIPKFSADSVGFNLTNTQITNQLEYIGTIYSIGSNGQTVFIPDGAGTSIIAVFSNMQISSATGNLPIQRMNYTNTIQLSDSTMIESAELSSGRGRIVISNNMDLNLNTKIIFDNLFNKNGNKFFIDIPLHKFEQKKIVSISSLAGWTIQSLEPGIPSNKLTYSTYIISDSTGEVSTITKNDSVAFNVNFENLFFKSFSGILKPTLVNVNESSFSLDFGGFDTNLDFSSVNFKNASISLNLNTSSDLKFLLNGTLTSTNGSQTNSLVLNNILLPSVNSSKINISSLLNGYNNDLPTNFKMNGTVLLNPNYELGTIEYGDSVFGAVNFEIPLNIGIAQATFIDTIEINLSDMNEEDINNINYGEVTFSIVNSIPVDVKFKAVVLDSNYFPVLSLPIESNDVEFLQIPKPEVNAVGDVLSAGRNEQVLKLYNEDIRKFIKNKYMQIIVAFETADKKNVKFRTSDKINISVKGSASYRTEL